MSFEPHRMDQSLLPVHRCPRGVRDLNLLELGVLGRRCEPQARCQWPAGVSTSLYSGNVVHGVWRGLALHLHWQPEVVLSPQKRASLSLSRWWECRGGEATAGPTEPEGETSVGQRWTFLCLPLSFLPRHVCTTQYSLGWLEVYTPLVLSLMLRKIWLYSSGRVSYC